MTKMPFHNVYITPEPFIEYKGITIYRCYIDDDIEQPETFIFSTNEKITDSTAVHPAIFDIRESHPELYRAVEDPRDPHTTAGVMKALMEVIDRKSLKILV